MIVNIEVPSEAVERIIGADGKHLDCLKAMPECTHIRMMGEMTNAIRVLRA
jgi:hypothetical protein